MTPYHKRVTAFTQRMAQDMQLRNLSPRTIDAYTYHVDRFALRFGKHPEELGPEQVREFQLWMIHDLKSSWSQFNQAVCGLRFLYEITLGKPRTIQRIPFGKRPKKLPTVLGDEEVRRLLGCVPFLKHRSARTTCYAAGLRLSEAAHLKISDIDGSRSMLDIRNGKPSSKR